MGCTHHQLYSWVWVRAGYPMVGRSFGHDLAGACIVRRSLYHTHWVCAVCCAQWAVPTDQLAQFGTKRAKRGPGVRGLWPQLWAPTISPVLGGSITSPPVGGSITSLCLRWVDYFVMRPSGGLNWDSKFERHWAGGTGRSPVARPTNWAGGPTACPTGGPTKRGPGVVGPAAFSCLRWVDKVHPSLLGFKI